MPVPSPTTHSKNSPPVLEGWRRFNQQSAVTAARSKGPRADAGGLGVKLWWDGVIAESFPIMAALALGI